MVAQDSIKEKAIKIQLIESEKTIDVHLARITHLQKLLDLEEARLLRTQAEHQELRAMLSVNEMAA